jgi:UDP-N-acetylmuramoylalanine--D-glutamate ligase
MKVAIAGYGIEGKASVLYWQRQGAEITIVDERDSLTDVPPGVATMLGQGVFDKLADFDMVIRTASLRPDKIHTNGTIWSATNEFFARCPAPIIGVTGTKGKGTTCSFITSILRAAGKTVHLVGNIGVPALEILPQITAEDIVVYELSSFQLWDLERSPHIAVVLMIEPDHLDVHRDYDEYTAAKRHIVQFQSAHDSVFYHPTNAEASRIAHTSIGHIYAYASDESVYVNDDMFCNSSGPLCPTASVKLPGYHNLENACAAIAAVCQYDETVTDDVILTGISSFAGLPHRIKYIREVDGVRYFDDSYSSAPPATVAAVQAFDEPTILICGGYDRGLDYSQLAMQLSIHPTLKHIHLIGQTADMIAKALRENGFDAKKYTIHTSLNFATIFHRVHESVASGDIVLFSPGCASFDMFNNFTDRGEQFVRLVEEL